MLKKLPPPGGSFLFPGFDRISALKKVDFVQKQTLPVARTTCVSISGELSMWQEIERPFPAAWVAMHLIPARAPILKNISANGWNCDRPLAVEIDQRLWSSSNLPSYCKNLNLHPPLLIPCVILIIVNTRTILRTQVLLVTLAMASAQIITLNLVFRWCAFQYEAI